MPLDIESLPGLPRQGGGRIANNPGIEVFWEI